MDRNIASFQNNTKNLDQIIKMEDFDVYFALNQEKIAKDSRIMTMQNSVNDSNLLKNSSMSDFMNASTIDYKTHFKN